MELKDKVINFLGDSITFGYSTSEGGRFSDLIAARCGLKRANNYGIGGTLFAYQKDAPADQPHLHQSFCSRCKDMDPEADINFVIGGVNDYALGNAPMGHMSDRTPDTFYGACHYLMRALLETYPNAVNVVATPMHFVHEGGNPPLARYAEVIREVAAYYAIPVMDMFFVSGVQPQIPVQYELMMPDGVHPNDIGHARMADRIIGFLTNL